MFQPCHLSDPTENKMCIRDRLKGELVMPEVSAQQNASVSDFTEGQRKAVFWLSLIHIFGYALIATESLTKVNKAAIALLMLVGCWTLYMMDPKMCIRDSIRARPSSSLAVWVISSPRAARICFLILVSSMKIGRAHV